jgi:predicted metal-dependent enzyme (double-stranded beta helix superfamily)
MRNLSAITHTLSIVAIEPLTEHMVWGANGRLIGQESNSKLTTAEKESHTLC